MKDIKGLVLVAGLIAGFILAAFGNLIGYGIVAGMALTQACVTIDKASK
jgi:hypothetical protein